MGSISITTLGDLGPGDSLNAVCDRPGCYHWSEINIAKMVERYGAEFELAELRRRVKYCKCGARPPEVRVQHGSDGRPM